MRTSYGGGIRRNKPDLRYGTDRPGFNFDGPPRSDGKSRYYFYVDNNATSALMMADSERDIMAVLARLFMDIFCGADYPLGGDATVGL